MDQDRNKRRRGLVTDIENKYSAWGADQELYLRGLLQMKPLTYWDHVECDTLLSLQKTRTDFGDEEVYILYHQTAELIYKQLLHQMRTIVFGPVTEKGFCRVAQRLNSYASLLIANASSFLECISEEDYRVFSCALSPAGGFQSAQLRQVELHCTRLENLIVKDDAIRLSPFTRVEDLMQKVYWRSDNGGRDSRRRTLSMRLFEERYAEELQRVAKNVRGRTLDEQLGRLPHKSEELIGQLKRFDYLFNVKWAELHFSGTDGYRLPPGTGSAGGAPDEIRTPGRAFFPELWNQPEYFQIK